MKLSIVIPCWIMNEELDGFLKNCVESIKRWTTVDYELILVDNGSDLGSEFMELVADKYIKNEKNLGFGPACNQGVKAAEGDFICLMNDDIVVGKDWDVNLIETADRGFVSMPALMSKWPDFPQQWPKTDEDLSELYRFIEKEQDHGDWIKIFKNQPFQTFQPLDGFGALWMVKADILKKVLLSGGEVFDEEFKIGMWEDRDLWARFYLQGVSNMKDHRVWVYHIGNASWGKIPNQEKIFQTNQKIYERKLAEYGIIKTNKEAHEENYDASTNNRSG